MLHTTYLSDRTILIEGNWEQLRLFARMNHLETVQRHNLFQYWKGGQPAGWVMPQKRNLREDWRGLFDVGAVLVWTLECMIVPEERNLT